MNTERCTEHGICTMNTLWNYRTTTGTIYLYISHNHPYYQKLLKLNLHLYQYIYLTINLL